MSTRIIIREKADDGSVIEVLEPDFVNEILIDGVHGLIGRGAILRVNLFRVGFREDLEATPTSGGLKMTQIKGERREVVCRLAMSVQTFHAVAEWFGKNAEAMKQLKPPGSEENKA